MTTNAKPSNVILLVSCSASKRHTAEDGLRMRNLQALTYDEVLTSWKNNVDGVQDRYPALELYKGAYWKLIRNILQAKPTWKTLIVSAGLGLVEDTDDIPAYEATFSTNQPDSIPSHSEGSKKWFDNIGGQTRFKEYFEGKEAPILIVVLSHPYLKAIQPCLEWFQDRFGSDSLIVLSTEATKRAFPKFARSWIVLNEKMVHETGGVVGTLNASVLLWYVSNKGDELISHVSMTKQIAVLLEQTASKESLIQKNRKKRTKQEQRDWMVNWMNNKQKERKSISASGALREYRAEGWAGQDKKVQAIYWYIFRKKIGLLIESKEEITETEAFQYFKEKKYHVKNDDKFLTTFNDAKLQQWLRTWMKTASDSTDKNSAFEEYQAEGCACEQKKFGRLFDEVKDDLT